MARGGELGGCEADRRGQAAPLRRQPKPRKPFPRDPTAPIVGITIGRLSIDIGRQLAGPLPLYTDRLR